MIRTGKPGGWTFAALVTAILGGGGLAYLDRADSAQPPALATQHEQAGVEAEPITPLPLAMSLDNRKVELGRRLFHDAGLSGDGSAKTLEDAVRVMARYQLGEQISTDELKKIIAFLHTPTGEYQGKPLE
ncbi:MAG: hypothetical protein HY937_09240 [Nitrosomonadales bacterium]|nr:hypothetical protein [Nitrosomonadales bacterium]